MKYAIPITNLIRTPSLEAGIGGGLSNNYSYDGRFTVTSAATEQVKFGTRACRATATGSFSNSSSRGLYAAVNVPATQGEKVAVSYYLYSTVACTAYVSIRERNSSNTVVFDNNLPSVAIPANTWVRVGGILTVQNAATVTTTPTFYQTIASMSAGDMFYTDGYMVTKTDSLIDYRDGSFPGWSWNGTPNASESTGPYFVDKPIKVLSNLENQITRPNFLSAWGTYGTAGSVGVRSYSGGVLTLSATALATGARCYGVSNGRVSALLAGNVMKSGEWRMTMRITVDATGLAPGTTAIFYADLLNGSTYVGGRQINIPAGTTGDLYFTQLVMTDFTSSEAFIWMNSTTGSDWSGSTEVKVSKAMIVFHRENEDIAYFDGDSPGCSWNGVAGSSRSFKPIWRTPLGVSRWDGVSWVLTS